MLFSFCRRFTFVVHSEVSELTKEDISNETIQIHLKMEKLIKIPKGWKWWRATVMPKTWRILDIHGQDTDDAVPVYRQRNHWKQPYIHLHHQSLSNPIYMPHVHSKSYNLWQARQKNASPQQAPKEWNESKQWTW